jgi:hypothetical protein
MTWLDQAMPFPIPASLLGHSAHALTGGALRDQPAAGLGWALAGATLALALAAGARRLLRRAVEAEDAAARARRALAEAERLAAVGREASQVAHKLANAVAVVRANVRWLAEPDQADAQAERVQAVQETVEAADRIAALAAELRRVAGEPRHPAPRRGDGGPGEQD